METFQRREPTRRDVTRIWPRAAFASVPSRRRSARSRLEAGQVASLEVRSAARPTPANQQPGRPDPARTRLDPAAILNLRPLTGRRRMATLVGEGQAR
jgi:hypothetical protein